MRDDQPSSTAINIAMSLLLLSHDQRLAQLVPREDVALLRQALLRHGGHAATLVRAIGRSRALQWFCWGLERRLLSGSIVHLALRKRVIDFLVRSGIERGCRQVVVVGAGLDPLAIRLAKSHPDCMFIEIDHPATQEIKRGMLPSVDGPRNLALGAADLATSPLDQALRRVAAFDSGAPTVFVVEGLLMYLHRHQVQNLLRAIAELPCEAKWLIFTFMEKRGRGGVGFAHQSRVVDWWLARCGERMKSAIDPVKAGAFVGAEGWMLAGVLRAEQLREILTCLPPGPRIATATGECVAWATMPDRAFVGARLRPGEPELSAQAVAEQAAAECRGLGRGEEAPS